METLKNEKWRENDKCCTASPRDELCDSEGHSEGREQTIQDVERAAGRLSWGYGQIRDSADPAPPSAGAESCRRAGSFREVGGHLLENGLPNPRV